MTSEDHQVSGIADTDTDKVAEEEHIDENVLAAEADPAKQVSFTCIPSVKASH